MEENRSFDKNQIIGFVLIGILIIAFSWLNSSDEEVPPAENTTSVEQVEETNITDTPVNEPEATEVVTEDTIVPAPQSGDSLRAFASGQTYTLENELLKIDFSGSGGQMTRVWLKEYQTWDTLPLNLVDGNNALYNFDIGGGLNSKDLAYEGRVESSDSSKTLYLTSLDADGELVLWFRLFDGDYRMDAGVKGSGLALPEGSKVDLVFGQDAIRTEKNRTNELRTTTIYYWENEDDDYDYLSLTSDDEDEIENVKWVGHKQQFFSTIITAGNQFDKIKVGSAELTGEEYTKRLASVMTFSDKAGSDVNINYQIFFGPNHYNTLKAYDLGYGKIIDFGWGIFGWISRFVVIPIFNWLDNYGLNYGLIILIMALMIKIVLFPLTYQSYKSMAKMRVLKPEMDELNEKFKDKDQMEKQQATMNLYREAGVNPLGGCIPQLVQLPILIAMFRFFPASIELRQKSFLWANDLSTYDDLIRWTAEIPYISNWMDYHISLFTLLMTISTFIYTAMNQQLTGTNSQMPQMKYIMYGMPIMLFFWFNSYASGLSYYYLVANIITFSQQWLIRRTLDDDAIHAKLQAKKNQPKKKSKFQQQMEEMQKKQGGRRTKRSK